MKDLSEEQKQKNKKRRRKRFGRFLLVGIIALIGAAFLYVIPRLSIVTGYVAKEVCSCIFVAERDTARTKLEDVGYFPINLATFSIDENNKTVSSNIYGFAIETAVYRPYLGCALIHEVSEEEVQRQSFNFPMVVLDTALSFPYGNYIEDTIPNSVNAEKLNSAMDFAMNCKGTRSAMVIYKGQIIGEQYADGFDENSKHLGWSISKSITNTLYGVLVKKGIVTLDESPNFANWTGQKQEIKIDDLLQMNSGLEWEEEYYDLSSVTRMLFNNDDLGAYAANAEIEFKPAEHWEYSSGTSNILSEVMEKRIGNQDAYWIFPYMELFNKIGATSMTLEADASGTYVGSSYAWATTRDWARLGQLYLNDGLWNEERILPEGWVEYSTTPAEGSEGIYGAQIWLNTTGKYLEGCPKDLYNFGGFNGQNITMIPSKDLVILRFGLNSIEKLDYAAFVQKVVEAVE